MKNLLYIGGCSLFIIACGGEDSAGITTTENTDLGIKAKVPSSVEGSKVYLFDEASPFQAIDSTIAKDEVAFTLPDSNAKYRISIQGDQQGALSNSFTHGDSISLALKNYTTDTVLLQSTEQNISGIQMAYGQPTAATSTKDEYTLNRLEDSTKIEFKTSLGNVSYQIEEHGGLYFKPLAQQTPLKLQVTKGVFDQSLWKLHYDFETWDGSQHDILDHQQSSIVAELSTPIPGKLETVHNFERQVLNFTKDAYFSTPFTPDVNLFSASVLFKTSSDNAGILQLTSSKEQILNGSSTWNIYLRDSKIIVVGLNSKNIGQKFDIKANLYKKSQWNTILLQFSKEQSLQIWINGNLAGSGDSQQIGSPAATYLTLGYVNDLNQLGLASGNTFNGYFRGQIASVSFYNKMLSESEIKALEP